MKEKTRVIARHAIAIILPSKFACGTILRWLNSHHALSGYSKENRDLYIYL